MTTSALDLTTLALEALQVYAAGEAPQDTNNADQQRMLKLGNNMLDMWSNEHLMVFAKQQISFTLTVNKTAYTIGTSGSPDINTTRPLDFARGAGIAQLQDGNGNNFPFEFKTREEWLLIGNRTVTSQIPDTGWYDQAFPNGVINIFPTPLLAYTLYADADLQLVDLALLSTTISLPPGYEVAIWTNLARFAKSFFKGKPLDPDLLELARESKAAIKRTNMKTPVAAMDAEIVARATPTYNIFRDNRN